MAISLLTASSASAGTVPAGFEETTAFSGLTHPSVVRFAPDGKVYVAEKSGLIKTFDGLDDSTPTIFADLRTKVHNFWDRGLLGMELDFYYETWPFVYVLYTHDAAIGGTAPRWGSPGATSDGCPNPPGATGDGCVVSGRLSRLVPQGNGSVREDVLIEDWCQQYPSHSTGALEMDRWGALYASAGDGASFNFTDWGQDGNPVNPCADPNREGGGLRSQDVRSTGDPVSLDGSVIRVDVRDGSGFDVNPMSDSTDPNARRIIASGLRNPFRFDVSERDELWVGDVGWNTWEEINQLPYHGFHNFGWPCYEGDGRQAGYDAANLALCETLYGETDAVTDPYFAYDHAEKVVDGESCPAGSSSIAGVRIYDGEDATSFPGSFEDALFFADYSRDCIWVLRAGADGRPDPETVSTFDAGASNPVWLEVGPDGALYYADFDGGRIQRIQSTAANQSPTAVIEPSATSGEPPLSVSFDGRDSSDPEGDSLDYAWDLDGDGDLDDSTSPTPSHTYTAPGDYDVTLRVDDGRGGTGTATVTIDVGNDAPVPKIARPRPAKEWSVGERITFSGSAMDPEDGPLPATGLDWELILNHCPSNCHSHPVQAFPDVAGGVVRAPDHEYPSHLELRLTATDSSGEQASTSVQVHPRTVELTLASAPAGLDLVLNGSSLEAPFTRDLIKNSTNSISAPSPQDLNGRRYKFTDWSIGGRRTRNLRVKDSRTVTANYRDVGPAG